MSDDLTAVEDWVAATIARLDPAARTRLAKTLARQLRASQAARIAAQQDPDGQAFVPRKPQKKRLRAKAGALKTGPMFTRLRLAKRLKILQATPDEIGVGFAGRDARIAAVHQDGLTDAVSGRPGAKQVRYPARRLLGFTGADREQLLDAVLASLQN